jgi:hypothetical protein
MNPEELYERWKDQRRQVEAPGDFAARVMAAVEAAEAQSRGRSFLTALLLALLSSRLGRISVCSLAAATCLMRLWHVVAIFVPS